MMPKVTASGLANMSGAVTEDGRAVVIGLKTKDGKEFQCALNHETLTKCVGFLLGLAEQTGQKSAPDNQKTATVTAHPLPISQIGIARGRSDKEAILAVQTGILRLVFSTEPATLLGMCDNLRKQVVQAPPSKPN